MTEVAASAIGCAADAMGASDFSTTGGVLKRMAPRTISSMRAIPLRSLFQSASSRSL